MTLRDRVARQDSIIRNMHEQRESLSIQLRLANEAAIESQRKFLAQMSELVEQLKPKLAPWQETVVYVSDAKGNRHRYSPLATLQLLVDGLPVKVQNERLVASKQVKRQVKKAARHRKPYSVKIKVGPTYSTRKEAAVERMRQLLVRKYGRKKR